jgi:cytidine deaminase
MSIQSYIEICKQKRTYTISLRTPNKLDFFHSCVIFNHNCFDKFITYGENQDRLNYNSSSIHAEECCLYKLKPITDNKFKKIDLLVVRVSKGGSLNMSKPCGHCIKLMKNLATEKGYSVKNVYYTESNDVVVKTSLNKLLNDDNVHISKYYRRRHL